MQIKKLINFAIILFDISTITVQDALYSAVPYQYAECVLSVQPDRTGDCHSFASQQQEKILRHRSLYDEKNDPSSEGTSFKS